MVHELLFSPRPRFNIAPGQPLAAICEQDGERALLALRWGLVPSWAKDPSIGNRLINARAESLADKPAFRNALRRRRCLIPADGFYEWATGEPGRGRQPIHIQRRDGELFAFAGLWEQWQPPGEGAQPLHTCVIITVEPNQLMAPIHDRMPAILSPEQEADWLDPRTDPDALPPLLRPYPEELLVARPVSRRVNAPTYDGPECLNPPF